MTIDEAIKDLEYGTEQLEMEIKSGLWIKESEPELSCKEGVALNKQYIEWLTELKEAKRLLKAAFEDIVWLNEHTDDGEGGCLIETATDMETCLACPLNVNNSHLCGWKHQVEALNLIEKGEKDEG